MKKDTLAIWDRIFGDWFVNIIIFVLLVPTIVILVMGVQREWINKDFGIQLLFLLIGLIAGKFLEQKRGSIKNEKI